MSTAPGHRKKITSEITAAFAPGFVVESKYRILSVVGEGAMGTVLLAEDVALDRLVAVKVINAAVAEAASQYFHGEARAMARVRHPNVAQVFAFGDHDGYPFFVMEFIAGESVRSYLERQGPGGLSVDVALGMLDQLAGGLDEVHRQGIVHYDVKPENMIIGPEYRVYLVDFGVAQPTVSALAELVGTPPYIAPEVLAGADLPKDQRHLADVFSLAVCAFEFFAGAPPFEKPEGLREATEMLAWLRDQSPLPLAAFRPDLPDGYGEELSRSLASDPRARHPSCEELVRALQRVRAAEVRQGADVRRVLIVDDDEDVRTLFGAVFEAVVPDAEIQTAADGLSAFELAKAMRPTLIVVDLNMPEVNGLELCSLLRANDQLLTVPVVVASAQLDASTRQLLGQLGVEEMLAKPVSPRELAALAARFFPPV